jgi:hypothetical protein
MKVANRKKWVAVWVAVACGECNHEADQDCIATLRGKRRELKRKKPLARSLNG